MRVVEGAILRGYGVANGLLSRTGPDVLRLNRDGVSWVCTCSFIPSQIPFSFLHATLVQTHPSISLPVSWLPQLIFCYIFLMIIAQANNFVAPIISPNGVMLSFTPT
jgi:hypothetical protein